MKFLNYNHEQRFERLCDQFSSFKKNDKAAMTLLYIAAGNKTIEKIIEESFHDTFHPKVFELTIMQSADLSESENVLISLAAALFNGSKKVDVTDFSLLKNEDLQLAVNALVYRYEPVKSLYKVETEPFILKEDTAVKYVSQNQIAEMLNENGIEGDRRKVSVYLKKGYLPEPSAFVGTAPGWTEDVIREWIEDYKAGKIVPRRKR